MDTSGLWEHKVVTELEPAGDFWEAEPEHQDYLEKHPGGYTCHFPRPKDYEDKRPRDRYVTESARLLRVLDARLDPEQARRFLFTTATGEIVRCDIDARVGGKYVLVARRNGEDLLHEGAYLELKQPRPK